MVISDSVDGQEAETVHNEEEDRRRVTWGSWRLTKGKAAGRPSINTSGRAWRG